MSRLKRKNAFNLFIEDLQQKLFTKRKIKLNNQKLLKIANKIWRNMSDKDRAIYLAKSQIKIWPKNFSEKTTTLLDEDNNEEFLVNNSDILVKNFVEEFQKTNLITTNFFIIGSNMMVKTGNNVYPIEISIAQYSVLNGIELIYHQFIDAGPIPIGYACLSEKVVKEHHNTLIQNFNLASNDYNKIMKEITIILKNSRLTDKNSMIVFCREDEIKQNELVLKWLEAKYKSIFSEFKLEIEVLDLVKFIYFLSEKSIIPEQIEKRLKTLKYDYSLDTNCTYHDMKVNSNCANGYVNHLCYTLSNLLCPMFNVKLSEDHLLP